MKTVLIVEDDLSLNKGIALTLSQDGLSIKQAYNYVMANEIFLTNDIDLILLDINLPDGNGLDLCRSIRQSSNVPIIFLTANDMETDIVIGFNIGGDDYITKPFSLMVLRARVMAALRRFAPEDEERIVVGEMVFDFARMEFSKGCEKIVLSKTEQKLLKILISNKGNILTRDQLMEKIWAQESEFVDENALTVTVKRLRAKIEDEPASPKYVKTVYGLGYVWAGGSNEKK